MRLGDDFDKLPFVHKFIFKQDLEASRRILARFSYGKDLFPADPLSELADKIIVSPALPLHSAEWIARDLVQDTQGKPGSTVTDILTLLEKFGSVTLTEEVTIPDLAKINDELDRVWKQRRGSFFVSSGGIGFYPVRVSKDPSARNERAAR
jgi:hypothetical protein